MYLPFLCRIASASGGRRAVGRFGNDPRLDVGRVLLGDDVLDCRGDQHVDIQFKNLVVGDALEPLNPETEPVRCLCSLAPS